MRLAILLLVLAACGDSLPAGDCREGETRECYSGPPGTEGVGECAAGIESCAGGKFSGICVGDVTPFVERCDGRDEDCSGTIDDVEQFGDDCMSADDCPGTLACAGAQVACAAPKRNACDVCGGIEITDVDATCTTGNCGGFRVCNSDGTATECNAPAENACGLCGGPLVTGLGSDCTAVSGCPGIDVCNAGNDGAVCDCNPEPGLCRDGSEFRAVLVPQIGDLVITEVMPSPSGDDTLQEWFEVIVVNDVDLNELGLDRVNDSVQPDVVESVDCIRVTAGTRLVFARNADPVLNGGLPAVAGTFSFAIVGGSVASPGDLRLLAPDGGVLDAISWTSSASAKSLQLDPAKTDPTSNDNQANFCDATTSYNGGADLGTPGAANASCPVVVGPGQCIGTAGVRAIVKPAAGSLVITEALVNPANVTGFTDPQREWFEVTNIGGVAFDLNELIMKTPGTAGDAIQAAGCLSVGPGTFALFARSSNATDNAGLPTPDVIFNFSLVDTPPNAGLSILDGATVLDAVVWTSVVSGLTTAVDPDHVNTTENDVFNVTAGVICHGATAYGDGSNKGTPRAGNEQCP